MNRRVSSQSREAQDTLRALRRAAPRVELLNSELKPELPCT